MKSFGGRNVGGNNLRRPAQISPGGQQVTSQYGIECNHPSQGYSLQCSVNYSQPGQGGYNTYWCEDELNECADLGGSGYVVLY